jgi:hypothetical protein
MTFQAKFEQFINNMTAFQVQNIKIQKQEPLISIT